jgi:ParB-like chromosome segregation protein Spo0J
LIDQIERVRVDSLTLHPQNARRGDVKAIATSLRVNEQFSPIVVQASTRYVLSGNHTLMAARELGWEEIDTVFVDVDDDRAYKIMLAANRTADIGGYDNDALAELLSYLDGDYEGTGYTDADVAALIIPPQLPEEGDAPIEDTETTWGVIVECLDEQQQTELLERLAAEGRRVRALMA